MALAINGTTGISGVDGSASAPALQGSDSNTGVSFGTDTVNINTGGSTRATVDSSGRFLIGTTSYKSNLNSSADTSGQISQFHHAGDNVNGCLSVFAYSGSTSPTTRGCKLQLHRARSSDGSTNTTLSNGDLIGSVDFKGNDGTSFSLSSKIEAFVDGGTGTDDMPGRLVFSTSGDGSAAPTERMRIHSNGNITIGHTQASGNHHLGIALRQAGTSSFYTTGSNALDIGRGTNNGKVIQFNRSGTNCGDISCTLNVTSYNTSSDYRLKENVVAISDGITRLKTLKPSRFNFKTEKDTIVDGFLAHEVTAVPEAISGTKDELDSDNNPIYQGIDQSKLVPLLTAALQEAIAKIETLETKVAVLEAA